MERICSSAFGDRREKCSKASKSIAAGEVDPGLNTERVDADEDVRNSSQRDA